MLNLVLLPLSLCRCWMFNRASCCADQGSLADPYRPFQHDCNSKFATLPLLQKILPWCNVCEIDNTEKDTNDHRKKKKNPKKTYNNKKNEREIFISIWAATENNHLVLLSPSDHLGPSQEDNHLSQTLKSKSSFTTLPSSLCPCWLTYRSLERWEWIMGTLRKATSFSDWRVIS